MRRAAIRIALALAAGAAAAQQAPTIETVPLAPLTPGGTLAPQADPGPGSDGDAGAGPGAAPLDEVAPVLPGARIPGLDELPASEAAPGRFQAAPAGPPPAPAIIDPVATDLAAGALIRQLDKLTGDIEEIALAAGAERQVDRLRIHLDACRAPPDGSAVGTMAHLKIWDVRRPETPDFAGWMFADSPALSALDHPRYDVWVIRCTTAAPPGSAPNP